MFGFSLIKNGHSARLAILLLSISLAACTDQPRSTTEGAGALGGTVLTVYSGRSQSLVEPLLEQFEEATGVDVHVRYGDTAELAVALTEEGEQSPADLFWAQDGGGLGAVHAAGLFDRLPSVFTAQVPPDFSNSAATWIATSARARTLAYSPDRIASETLPQSILNLTDPEWKGRVGWAPTNGSFQAFVTALRKLIGDEATRQWLIDMKANEPVDYPRNAAIIAGIAAGEIDLGLPNHYYLLRNKSEDPNYPVEQTFFRPGDPGNLVNVAGIGILTTTGNPAGAEALVEFLLSREAQLYFTNEVFEYPVVHGVTPNPNLSGLDSLAETRPKIDLETLADLEATLQMLRDVEIL